MLLVKPFLSINDKNEFLFKERFQHRQATLASVINSNDGLGQIIFKGQSQDIKIDFAQNSNILICQPDLTVGEIYSHFRVLSDDPYHPVIVSQYFLQNIEVGFFLAMIGHLKFKAKSILCEDSKLIKINNFTFALFEIAKKEIYLLSKMDQKTGAFDLIY